MAVNQSVPFKIALAFQKRLDSLILDETLDPTLIDKFIGKWIELERFKREMRGIPPLAPIKLTELETFRRDRYKRGRLKSANGAGTDGFIDLPPAMANGDAGAANPLPAEISKPESSRPIG